MILPLDKADIAEAGGKARGLARLINLGMNVPEGIVIIPEESVAWKTELEKFTSSFINCKVAVRSSALAEDGEKASFAGQFSSYLNCEGEKEIISAVNKCFQSVKEKRAGSYREHFHIEEDQYIPVIIQVMAGAVKSGVIFTANPIHQRTDKWVINATTGLADELMAGAVSGEQIILTRNGRIDQKGNLLTEKEINNIYQQAKKIADHFQRPMDLEWTIDKKGAIYWVQARPITTLKQVHLNELDGQLFTDNEIFTRANIGEMMPGPVTPLTYSVFGRAIEVGLQDFYIASGAQKAFTDDWLYFRMFYNHLFFSMTNLVEATRYVWLNKKENIEFAIMGDTLDDGRKLIPKPFPVTIWNQIKQIRYLASGAKRMKKLNILAEEFKIHEQENLKLLYAELTRSLDIINQAYAHHYCTSSQSGSYQSALMAILSEGKTRPSVSNYRDAALLLANLNNVESADVVHSVNTLYKKYKDHQSEIIEWLQAELKRLGNPEDPGKNIQQFSLIVDEFHDQIKTLIDRHGHRCIREAELREKSWEEDPVQLFNLIIKRFQAGDIEATRENSYKENYAEIVNKSGLVKGFLLKKIIPKAREAVGRREYTKSLAVKIQQRIKKGYNRLAELMVEKNLLDDTDQVYFLTHCELGKCIESEDICWKNLASERRNIFPESFKLRFPTVSEGYPEPLPMKPEKITINGNALEGLPVSTGSIEAKIRIIRKPEDAENLDKGEIMVCQYTDVGWTPYFSLAAGLITEIGSPLSHGAVVAREYGIPAVVNAKGALDFFHTGEKVLLDGEKGVIRKLN